MIFFLPRKIVIWIAMIGTVALAGCDPAKPENSSGSGGTPKTTDSSKTDVKAPLKNHLNCALAFVGVHLRKDKPSDAVNAYHYCAVLNDELTQCILYDGLGTKARLLGVEYLVPAKVYEAMPEDEKPYWHHHRYEVDDQLLKSLTQSGEEEKATLKVVRTLYGKIFHTWVKGDKYPAGPAKLFFAVYGKDPFVLPKDFDLPKEIKAVRKKK